MAERFSLNEIVAARMRSGRVYREFLRKSALSGGVYVLAANAEDPQKPHREDEIYYVLAGRARFQAGDTDQTVAPGDIMYVPAQEPHRFHAIEEELRLLVFFAPAESNS
jgi:quercetin dioxygenase-like cupin family protein